MPGRAHRRRAIGRQSGDVNRPAAGTMEKSAQGYFLPAVLGEMAPERIRARDEDQLYERPPSRPLMRGLTRARSNQGFIRHMPVGGPGNVGESMSKTVCNSRAHFATRKLESAVPI